MSSRARYDEQRFGQPAAVARRLLDDSIQQLAERAVPVLGAGVKALQMSEQIHGELLGRGRSQVDPPRDAGPVFESQPEHMAALFDRLELRFKQPGQAA